MFTAYKALHKLPVFENRALTLDLAPMDYNSERKKEKKGSLLIIASWANPRATAAKWPSNIMNALALRL